VSIESYSDEDVGCPCPVSGGDLAEHALFICDEKFKQVFSLLK